MFKELAIHKLQTNKKASNGDAIHDFRSAHIIIDRAE